MALTRWQQQLVVTVELDDCYVEAHRVLEGACGNVEIRRLYLNGATEIGSVRRIGRLSRYHAVDACGAKVNGAPFATLELAVAEMVAHYASEVSVPGGRYA